MTEVTTVNHTVKELEDMQKNLDNEFRHVLMQLGDIAARLEPMLRQKDVLIAKREEILQQAQQLNKELQGAKQLQAQPNA